MKWRLKKGKYIIEKDSVFFSITPEQIPELQTVLNEIGAGKGHAVKSNSNGLVMPCGLRESDTLEDAIKRADSLASPTRYSGTMIHNKDQRRIVRLAYELRKLQA